MTAELLVDVIAHYLQRLAGTEVGQQALQRVAVQQLLVKQLGEAGADGRLAPWIRIPSLGLLSMASPKWASRSRTSAMSPAVPPGSDTRCPPARRA